MSNQGRSPYLDLLRGQIDIARVPFSDRGSRILVFQDAGQTQLDIKLATRIPGLETGTPDFVQRRPLIRGLCFTDEAGRPLDFRVDASPEELRFKTKVGEFGLVFQDEHALAIGLPPQKSVGLRFKVSTDPLILALSGVEAGWKLPTTCTTNGESLHHEIQPEQDGWTMELVIRGGDDLTISLPVTRPETESPAPRPFSEYRSAARARWTAWFDRTPPVDAELQKKYAYAWWVIGSNLINPAGQISYEAVMPSKMKYVGVWLWDSAFHALALRHVDPVLARNQLRQMLRHQRPSGMLPDALTEDGPVFEIDHPFQAEVTKPPLFGWTALKLHEAAPDESFLRELYSPLARLIGWWSEMNDDDRDGLVQYNHPYSSGLDDSPLWDYGMPVESPDLNTYLCREMDSLAGIAEILGLQAEAIEWKERAQAIVARMIEDLWDEEEGIFRAVHEERPIPVATPFNLLPLWSGRLPQALQQRLLSHLANPGEFWCEYGLPTVARNDPHYDPERMWRGPAWANVNYFFIEALSQCGRTDLAGQLRDRTLRMILGDSEMSEYYNSTTGQPPSEADRMFAWTAAVFIELALAATAEAGRKNHPQDLTAVGPQR